MLNTVLALLTGAFAATAYFIARENRLKSDLTRLESTQHDAASKLAEIDSKLVAANQHEASAKNELERISGLTPEQAKAEAISKHADSIGQELDELVRSSLRDAQTRAAETVLTAIERTHVTTISESTTAVVPIPSEDVKGRIIGREGRNIRAFEQATGTELLLDATPGSVLISCFDPLRRETARISLMNLMVDGRIHPTRIEEIVAQCQQTIRADILEAGKEASREAEVTGLPNAVVQQLGLLRFRSSIGQNVLSHSVEVAQIAANLATELGFDVQIAREAGLLHDIGKGLNETYEGPHALTGMRFLTEHKVDGRILHAVAAHHYDVMPETPEARLVIVADSISASRPGARKENLDHFATRLADLEKIALEFPGVERAYVIQSGRELRVLVRPEQVDDAQTQSMSKDIAAQITAAGKPGLDVLVTVIRETRAQSRTK